MLWYNIRYLGYQHTTTIYNYTYYRKSINNCNHDSKLFRFNITNNLIILHSKTLESLYWMNDYNLLSDSQQDSQIIPEFILI